VNIYYTELYETQLKQLLANFADEDFSATKSFKIYLDTIIINMPTKFKKYKKSIYFDDENIRDIAHENFLIPFFIDEKNDSFLILGILEKRD
jgi:hypothetical protein